MLNQIIPNNASNNLPDEVHQLAFNKQPGEPFTETELAIIKEWDSGLADDLMKFSLADPNLLQYFRLYDTLEKKKHQVWLNAK